MEVADGPGAYGKVGPGRRACPGRFDARPADLRGRASPEHGISAFLQEEALKDGDCGQPIPRDECGLVQPKCASIKRLAVIPAGSQPVANLAGYALADKGCQDGVHASVKTLRKSHSRSTTWKVRMMMILQAAGGLKPTTTPKIWTSWTRIFLRLRRWTMTSPCSGGGSALQMNLDEIILEGDALDFLIRMKAGFSGRSHWPGNGEDPVRLYLKGDRQY